MEAPRYRAITRSNVESMPQWSLLDREVQEAIRVVSLVLPFRVSEYVTNELIDWSRVPHDPMFQLTFPQREMLEAGEYAEVRGLLESDAEPPRVHEVVHRIRTKLNPHPAGQLTRNVPLFHGERLRGVQHKYRQSVLFFPTAGQTCHAYCTFCFRWAQFVGDSELRFASKEIDTLVSYLRSNPHITDVIFTGGDPMVMSTVAFRRYVEPLLAVETVQTIRIGTKSLAYWPHRFDGDRDADDLLQFFEEVVTAGKHLAFMAHVSHPIELSTSCVERAIGRIRSTGAVIRTQSPMVRRVNDDPTTWADMWTRSTSLGLVPYYMFVERDTGPHAYFRVPLVRCWEIFQDAYQRVSGIARTVRGPVMSCTPGKCHVLGFTEIGGEKAFLLEFLQARNPDLVRRPFFARYDPEASWFDELQPLTEADCAFLNAGSVPEPSATEWEGVR